MPSWKKLISSGSNAHLNHITASGHIEVAGNISGSATSTGSFGALSLGGGINVHGNSTGIGIGTTAPAQSLEIIHPTNNPQIQFTYGPSPTNYHNNIRADVGSAFFAFDLIAAGTTYTPLILGKTSISGSAKSTGSFGRIHIQRSAFSTHQNTDIDTGGSPIGTEDIASVLTSSYDGAFFDYVAISGSKNNNMRAGTVMAVWSAGRSFIKYTEVSTRDIGNTANLKLKVELAGSAAVLRGEVSSNNWNVKTLVRTI